MPNYLKPQSPLKDKDGDYIYPLTTADQVIMEDGSRLNSKLVSKDNVVNNFTTTQEGFVADARALKVLNEGKLNIANAFFGNNASYSQTAVDNLDTFLDTAPYGETVQTAYNSAEVRHGDYHMGNRQYVIFTINYERTYGWILVIGFGGMYFGYRRNSITTTWVKIA